jgi:hypothetical protein
MLLIRIMAASRLVLRRHDGNWSQSPVVQSNSHRPVEPTPGGVVRQQMLGVVGSREKIRRTAEKSPVPIVIRQAALGLVHRCAENTLVWRPQSVAPAWHPG